jgi:hypothetical protein
MNLLVILAYSRTKSLHVPCNLLLVNTAIGDFLVSLTTYSFSMTAAYLVGLTKGCRYIDLTRHASCVTF